MKNLELAKIFYDMADILELKGVDWKPIAFRKAARAIEEIDVEEVYREGGLDALEEIPGVGEKIGKKIIEFLTTGKVHEFEELKKSIPKGLVELLSVPGLGPKKAMLLYKKLKIKNIGDLEKAANKHRIRNLPTFKAKTEENIIKGIRLFRAGRGRMLLVDALQIANSILSDLRSLKEVKRAEVAGSLRRMKPTIGDIDLLVTSDNPKKVMDFAASIPEVKSVMAKGDTKSSLLMNTGIQVDIRVVEEKSFGAAMQYFTGNKEHNIEVRKIAIAKGFKLSEYGLFKGNKMVAGKTEEEIYKKLGMECMAPEIRENLGEIEAAMKGILPDLIPYDSIKGDLHVHSEWSDGNETIENIAIAAKRLGYEYICIADHSKSLKIANGLSEKRMLKKLEEIKKVNERIKGIRVLAGAEVDILKDGSLDYSDELLRKLDIVIASVHSNFRMGEEEMTRRIVKAVENEHVDIIGHPTGKMAGERDPYEVDIKAIMAAAKKYGKVLEINCSPKRFDLDEAHIRDALNSGVKLVIGTDAHDLYQLDHMQMGIAFARRGWAEKKDILNTLPLKDIKKLFGIRED